MERAKFSIPLPIHIETKIPSSQWADIVGRFTEAYNLGTQAKYKITEKRMAMRLAPLLKENEIGWLEWFYEDCKKARNFGAYFNYQLSPKANDPF
jgi:hypothetical protein